MNSLHFVAMPTETALAFQNGQPDANGQRPEQHISDGDGVPCRHCLSQVAKGEPYLILAYRPFPAPQPYAEIGPIFLHANACNRYAEPAKVPPMFLEWEHLLIRGYNDRDRIVYGTGGVVKTSDMAAAATHILEQSDVAYIHVRSAKNNCFQCRIEQSH